MKKKEPKKHREERKKGLKKYKKLRKAPLFPTPEE